MNFRNQKTRFALRLPARTQQALLPFVEQEDQDTARHFATVYRTIGKDVEVPMLGSHLIVIAKVAAQHSDIPQTHNVVATIANSVAR